MATLQVANKFVEKIVDEQREKWAKEWLYYGNNPPNASTYEMSRKIEREIWAMWILDQDFNLYSKQMGGFQGEVDGTWEQPIVEGRDRMPFHKLIVEKLIELGVVIPQTSRQFDALNHRNWGNPNKERPNVLIEGQLDDDNELSEIQNWAKNHQPETLAGAFGTQVRMLPSIIDVHK